ncbi:MAG TPA: prepilin-type N-terminal cleavage/methylation domain-containing protein [Verrucomicrobiae bacterium]
MGNTYKNQTRGSGSRQASGFTFVEVLVATLVVAILLAAAFGSINFGLQQVQLSREDLRATQVLLEKMEGIRLYTFDQLTATNKFPATFTALYSPLGTNNGTQGITYYGRFELSSAATGADYNSNLCVVKVSVTWTNGNGNLNIPRYREMKTLVGRYGVQNYSFYN